MRFKLHLKHVFCLAALLVGTFAMTFAQRQVSGKVTSAAGDPLIGATVLLKGTTSGALTGQDGVYSVTVPNDNTVLVFTYFGYSTQEVAVGSQSVVNVTMTESVSSLSEVVVTGYSTQSRREITGSVSVIDTKDLKKIASSNVADQLQGKVAGVQISTSGDPGSSAIVRIRGFGTVNNNEPLYVVDGIPIQGETNLNFLNPNDVESMQVLKDASAAAIFGTRAANGVVIITTKKGGQGSSKINVDIFTGIQSPPDFIELANPTQLLEINKGLAAGAGQPFSDKLYPNGQLPDFITRQGGFLAGSPEVDPSLYFLTPDPQASSDVNYLIQQANKQGTDWLKQLINSAPLTNYQVSASGGNAGGSYFISANIYDHEGIVIENDYTRYQGRINSQFSIKKKIRVGESINLAYQTTRAGIGNPGEGSALVSALRMPQLVPTVDITGNPFGAGAYGTGSNASNPVLIQKRSAQNIGHSFRMLGSFFVEADFLKHFTASSRFGVDYNIGRGKGYGFRNFEATEVNANNSLSENMFNNINWVFSNTLKYVTNLTDDLKLDALVGIESRNNYFVGFNASGTGLAFGDDPFYRTLGNVSGGRTVGGYEGSTSIYSQFGQVNFNFQDKYLLTATVRRDGSSKFLNEPYGVFPGASVGWRISNEQFMKDITFLSDLKLRAGYGLTGNNEASGDFPGYTSYFTSPGNSSYDINGTGNSVVSGFQRGGTVGNPDLKWETTKMLNVGFDATLWSKWDIIFEWYDRRTEDMIYPVRLPTTLDFAEINQNIGTMTNTGIDFQTNYRGEALNKELDFTVGLTFSQYTNEVLALDANDNTFVESGGTRIGNATRTESGFSISQYRGYIVDGLWGSLDEINSTLFTNIGDAKVGRFKFRDLNADGQINASDETYIGSPHPDFLFGLNLSLNYKNFDFTAYVQGVQGNELFNFTKYFTHFPAFQANYSVEMLEEAGKSLPVLDRNDNYSAQRNSFYVEDGSYIRGRNFMLGYTLPKSLLSKISVDRLRIYVQGQNIFTITDYEGFDPDITVTNVTDGFAQRRDLAIGVDNGRYPTPRTWLVGINLEF